MKDPMKDPMTKPGKKLAHRLWLAAAFLAIPSLSPAATRDTITKFASQYDFSEALRPKTPFLGFIEPNYRRLKIAFTSVERSASNPLIYKVQGTSQVRASVCKFSGTIEFNQVKKSSKMHYGLDDQLKDAGIQAQGKLTGRYNFEEGPKKPNCGVFKGKVTLFWYNDQAGKFRYDDIESSYSDNFRNNQYEGTWTGYGSRKAKVANWGEYRIPNSGDLDIGAGEFAPDPKYLKEGWEDLSH